MGRTKLPTPEFLSLTYTLPYHLVTQLSEVAESSNRSHSEVVADSIRLYLKAWAARTEQTRISVVDGFSYQSVAVSQTVLEPAPATNGAAPQIDAGEAPGKAAIDPDEQSEASQPADATAITVTDATADASPSADTEPVASELADVDVSDPADPEDVSDPTDPEIDGEQAQSSPPAAAVGSRPSAHELIARAAAKLEDGASATHCDVELPAEIADPGQETRIALLKLANQPLDSPKLRGQLQRIMRRVDVKDYSSPDHSTRVAAMALRLGKANGLHGHALRTIEMAALIHDIGKACIPEDILAKTRPSPEEMSVIRKYPEFGAELLRTIPSLEPLIPIVETQQERWNGSGYPDGRQGTDIPMAAQIVAICDVYDVLTTDRRYRQAYSEERAQQIITQSADTLWSPGLVKLFERVVLSATAGDAVPQPVRRRQETR